MRLADPVMRRRVKVPCGSDLLIAIFDDSNNRGLETAPTRDHKVTIPNVCGSDLLIAILESVHAKNRHRMNRWGSSAICFYKLRSSPRRLTLLRAKCVYSDGRCRTFMNGPDQQHHT